MLSLKLGLPAEFIKRIINYIECICVLIRVRPKMESLPSGLALKCMSLSTCEINTINVYDCYIVTGIVLKE